MLDEDLDSRVQCKTRKYQQRRIQEITKQKDLDEDITLEQYSRKKDANNNNKITSYFTGQDQRK